MEITDFPANNGRKEEEEMKHAANRRRGVSTRAFVALLALVLVIGCVAGGTVAWLVATTDSVTNTFTYGDINIGLTETKPVNQQAKIIPGVDIEKDPKVTVKANSENCWLFVKIDEKNVSLTSKEMQLLKLFLGHPKKVFTKANLYESVWNDIYYYEDNTVNVHMSNLRSKLKKISGEEYIETVWGVGYRLKEE